jgi:UDP-glucose 4-epimerase
LAWYDKHGISDVFSHLKAPTQPLLPNKQGYVSHERWNFSGAKVLVVGGAGFVGSNLVHQILQQDPREIIVVDNLLSSDVSNIPADSRVRFVFGSITDDRILAGLPGDLDYAFHLACFHGNQSSIADPFADHDNNTYTSLKLFDRLKEIKGLKKVVYAAAACAVAEKTYDAPTATTEDQPVTLYHDSPYSISKIIGELYGNYYFQQHKLPFVRARFSNVYGPREILGAGQWRGTVHTVWRNVTPTFIWRSLNGEALPLDNGGNASRDFIFVEDMARGLMACALKGAAGGSITSRPGEKPAFSSWQRSSTSTPAIPRRWISGRRATGIVPASASPPPRRPRASLASPRRSTFAKDCAAPSNGPRQTRN